MQALAEHKKGGGRDIDWRDLPPSLLDLSYPPSVSLAEDILPPGEGFSIERAIAFINGQPLSETVLAYALEDQLAEHARFRAEHGRWYLWDGTRWRPHDRAVMRAMMADLAYAASNGAPKSSCASFAAGAENIASWRSSRKQVADGWKWDADPHLLGTPTWTVGLKYGDLLQRPYSLNGITRSTSVAPCDRPHPKWDTFLDDITGGDDAMRDYLWRVGGYVLTGDISEHALFFLHGPGGNGKGVFTNTILRIMGEYGHQAPMEVFMASSGDRHPTELASLDGKRLVVASETEEGRHFAEARIKMLTGGDPITARRMRQDFFTFIPQFKLMLASNHQPNLRDVGDAMRRRVHMIPFLRKPEVVNKRLEEDLREEHDAILFWLILGAREWARRGLAPPEVVRASTERYFTDQDMFRQWLEDCCIVARDERASGAEPATLFASWKAYAEKVGEKPGTQKRFAAAMGRQGLHPDRRYQDGETRRVYVGVTLRAAPLMRERSDASDASDAISGLTTTRAHDAHAHTHVRARESDNWKYASDASDASEEHEYWPDDE